MTNSSKSSNSSTNTVNREVIDDLVLKCAFDVKHKDHCVSFTVEKKYSSYFRHILAFVLVSFFVYITELSKIFGLAFLLITLLYYLYQLSCRVRKESAYLFVPVGLQLNASFLLGNKSHTFISWSSIQDFLIVEVISRQRIIYCLIVLVNNSNGISYVTLFENTQPRLIVLEKVYRRFQTILKKQREENSIKKGTSTLRLLTAHDLTGKIKI